MSTRRILIIVILIIAVFTGGIAYGVNSLIGGGETAEGTVIDGVKEFRISSSQWSFDPATIEVEPGDTVRFIVTSDDITHGFAINELGLNLILPPGEEVIQEVVIPPDITEATFTMYCSIFCGIGHPYMKGNMVIGESGFEVGKILPYIATSIMVGMFAATVVIARRRPR